MSGYNEGFSKVYDKVFQQIPMALAPFIHDYYSKHSGFEKHLLLDVCCGTGLVANYFLKRGFEVTGIDISKPMITQALQKNQEFINEGKANFYVEDATNFKLTKKYTLAISTFNSLNHFSSLEQIKNCFLSVSNSLYPGGLFIFDVKTKFGYDKWNNIEIIDQEQLTFIFRGLLDGEKKKALLKSTGFVKEQGTSYHKFDELIINYWYNIKELQELLQVTGFTGTEFYSFPIFNQIKLEETELQDRVIIVTHKP